MKVLIVSDTHGRNHNLIQTIERTKPIDLLIHLGDFGGGLGSLEAITPCPAELVSGSGEYYNEVPKDKIIQLGKYRIMLTHGHRYAVKSNTTDILEAGEGNQADIVMFGHTHIPMIDLTKKVWLINPGSLSLPRQYGGIPTFIIMELDSNGEAHFTLNNYKEAIN